MAVTAGRHYDPDDVGRADVFELFSRQGRLSEAFAKRRRAALRPIGLDLDNDLRSERVREEALDRIRIERPKLLWVAIGNYNWEEGYLGDEDQQRRRAQAKQDTQGLHLQEGNAP